MTNSSQSTDRPRSQLWDLIKDIRFTMFTTQNFQGDMHAAPMTTQNKSLNEGETLCFFMSRRGDSTRDILVRPTVNLNYADPSSDTYVSISGRASVNDDLPRKRALWSKMNEAWFPGGVDDPDLALVEVTISHAHYWDVTESKMTQFFQMAKAIVTGEPPTGLGESGEI